MISSLVFKFQIQTLQVDHFCKQQCTSVRTLLVGTHCAIADAASLTVDDYCNAPTTTGHKIDLMLD